MQELSHKSSDLLWVSRKTYEHFLEKKKRGEISAGELRFSGSGAAGAIVNLKKPFVMDHRPAKNEGQALGTQKFLLQKLVTEWVPHNGHSEHQDLVHSIVIAEAVNLAFLQPDIRRRKAFQPSLALQDPVPASFVSFLPWSGSCDGTQVSEVLLVSMETGKQHQTHGHAP